MPQVEGSRHALIIGIDDYSQSKHFAPLQGATNDAEAMAKLLIQRCSFPEANVKCLTSKMAAAAQPTNENIKEALADLMCRTRPNDLVFIYVAGHGVTIGDTAFLVPYDTKIRVDEATASVIVEPFVMNLMEASNLTNLGSIKAGRVIGVFDMCRNDPFAFESGPTRKPGLTRAMESGLSRFRAVSASGSSTSASVPFQSAVFFACQPGSISQENRASRRGFFTETFEDAFMSGDTNGDGSLTIAELESHLTKKLPERTGAARQVPNIISDNLMRDLVLGYTDKKPDQLKPVPSAVPSFVAAPTREITFNPNVKKPTGLGGKIEPVKFKVFDSTYQIAIGTQWCDIVSGEGGFSIRLPEAHEPQRRVETVTTPDGEAPMVEYYYQERRNYDLITYSAAYFDFPASTKIKTSKDILNWVKKALSEKGEKNPFGAAFQTDMTSYLSWFTGTDLGALNVGRLLGFGGGGGLLGDLGLGKIGDLFGGNKAKKKPEIKSREYNIADALGWRTEIVEKESDAYYFLQIGVAERRVFILREGHDLEEGKNPRYAKSFIGSFDFLD